ncbi:type IV secretory system conjugative DNA transfer family protein [Nocardia sp. BMG51109]|uniref:type IV secretory system conjugative DNA transfer family protein n=1 Tax=Nocardia sp. BMG51109 TaxID=1056816 RepID=UPI0018DD033D|nr:TraM recognition domain-containing protein [Nocardia sp. BMG51109]
MVWGRRKALGPLTEAGARQTADNLGVRLGYADAPGVAIGRTVAGGRRLYGSYEDMHVDIWGPRQGKTTRRVIPAILDAVGPVVATATGREVLDATRDCRYGKGSRVWVFDPDGVAGERPDWCWDPLAWVRGDEARAARLAGHFADADRRLDATDYFEIEGEELLAALFLAASLARFPITQVWEWVTNPMDTEAVQVLRCAERHHASAGVAALYNLDERTKSGIFGTARKMARCLRFPNLHPWVCHTGEQYRLDATEIVDENATLYLLSAPGRGTAVPVVNAFLDAVLDAARPSRIPMLAVLDDAADVVRSRDFPQRCGRYGADGVVVMAMLQSWAQGVRCWGPGGMSELWSAANIRVLGGGVDDVPLLRDGVDRASVAAVRSLPRGRAVLLASGVPPVPIEVEPWWEGPHADDVRASIRAHGRRRTTIDDLIEFQEADMVLSSGSESADTGEP